MRSFGIERPRGGPQRGREAEMDQEPRMRRGNDWYTPDSAVGCFVWLAVAIIVWVIIGIWWRPYWWPWWGAGNPNAQRPAPTQPYGGGPAYNGGPNQPYQQPYPNQGGPSQGNPNQGQPGQPAPNRGSPDQGNPQPAQP